jgi:hypothetical protein
MSRLSWLSIFLLCALLSAPPAVFAQSDRGTITGTVSDPAGAVVPAATLTLTNTGTAAAYDTVTTGTGNYALPSLPSGRYTLKVSARCPVVADRECGAKSDDQRRRH